MDMILVLLGLASIFAGIQFGIVKNNLVERRWLVALAGGAIAGMGLITFLVGVFWQLL